LRSFHDSKIASFVNNDYLNNKIKKNDSVLIKLQHLFSADQLKVIHSILLSGQEYFANHLIECVISHGDFGLDHIKLSKSNTYIIDFEDLQLAPREFDILFLLTNLEYTNYFPQRRGLHKKICNEFLEGYGMQLPVTPLNDLLYLSIKLNILERYQRLMKNYPVPGYKKYVYYYFLNEGMKRLAKWLDTIKCEMKESYFI
jgi:thiamine kinase-like enzyme